MNATVITNALMRDPAVKEKFVVVFAANTLPNKEYPGAYIANTDDAEKPGMHWVAFYTLKPTETEAFDSFGRHPALYSTALEEWLDGDFIVMSGVQRQSTDATTCGQYCMFFVLLRCHGFSYKDVQSALVRHKNINDKFVCKFVNKYFGLSTSVQDREFLLRSVCG